MVENNIIVNNSLHPHVWFENSGDVVRRNIVMGAYRPARMDIAKWGKEVDRNLFATSEADRREVRRQAAATRTRSSATRCSSIPRRATSASRTARRR